MDPLLKKPSALIPIVISFLSLLLIIGYVTMFGIQEPQADEGAPARIFQLVMGLQALMIIFFAIKWIPQKPKQALQVLILQIIAALVPFSLIIFLEM